MTRSPHAPFEKKKFSSPFFLKAIAKSTNPSSSCIFGWFDLYLVLIDWYFVFFIYRSYVPHKVGMTSMVNKIEKNIGDVPYLHIGKTRACYVLSLFQIVSHFGFLRCISFDMHLATLGKLCIRKGNRLLIWNGGKQREYNWIRKTLVTDQQPCACTVK